MARRKGKSQQRRADRQGPGDRVPGKRFNSKGRTKRRFKLTRGY